MYTPYVLLNEDIVFVIIQYRLGILGFLSTEDEVIPGNFGLKDQVMALQWIQKNIHSFGGDRKRVTIFGESAGGASVHFHVLSPRSEGLFARGILQSGTLFAPWAMGGAFKEVAKYTGDLFNCPLSDSLPIEQKSAALLSCLQTVDVVNLTLSLMNHIHWNFNPVLLGPRVDGDFLPKEPELIMKEGLNNKVDIISGVNTHEGGLFVSPLYANEDMKLDLLNNFDEMGPASLDITYGDSSPVELARKLFDYFVGGVKVNHEDADNLCKMYGDWQFALGHDLLGKLYARSRTQKKIYLYELNHRGQHSFGNFYDADVGENWVAHVDEIFYLFTGENVLWKPLERKADLKLRDIITKLWFNFASTGNPTPDDSLGFIWEAASEDNIHHLALNPSPSMENDHRQEVRKFVESLPTKQNFLLHPELVSPITSGQQDENMPANAKPRKYGAKDEL